MKEQTLEQWYYTKGLCTGAVKVAHSALFSTQVDVMLENVQLMVTHTNTQANGVN
jgi:hypothetical protein